MNIEIRNDPGLESHNTSDKGLEGNFLYCTRYSAVELNPTSATHFSVIYSYYYYYKNRHRTITYTSLIFTVQLHFGSNNYSVRLGIYLNFPCLWLQRVGSAPLFIIGFFQLSCKLRFRLAEHIHWKCGTPRHLPLYGLKLRLLPPNWIFSKVHVLYRHPPPLKALIKLIRLNLYPSLLLSLYDMFFGCFFWRF